MKFDITASIVAFRNNPDILSRAIQSFLATPLNVKLYLIDNSPSDEFRELVSDQRCDYIFNNANLGFGKAHNLALGRSLTESRYHLVLNPDVYFDPGTLESILSHMERHPEIGQLMPKILYPNGDLQYSGKLLPSPLDLFGRRLFKNFSYFIQRNEKYELRKSGYDKIMNVPQHLGCFMFLRTEALIRSGLFDERMFMYMEDIDLTRRMHRLYETVYFPFITIYHHYEKGSKKNPTLLSYHIQSTIRYFNKWGWFLDKERANTNKPLLDRYA